MTTKELCVVIGYSGNHISRLKKQGVIKNITLNRWDLPKCVQDIKEHLGGPATGGTYTQERLKLVTAQRKQIELNNSERKKELIKLDDVQLTFDETSVMFASQLDGLPGRMASELAGIDDPALIRKVLFEETRRIRNATADKFEMFIDSESWSQDTEDTTSTDGRSMGKRM